MTPMPIWLYILGVLGTYCIFVASLWGEPIRAMLFRPRLLVELVDPRGERLTETISTIDRRTDSSLQQYQRQARYYRVAVTNSKP
jgi:hypothetical protein